MNNGLKALLIAASTIITCIIVGLGFSMAREAKQIGNHVVDELHRYRNAIEERDLMKYDGVTVYGADVTNLMKRLLSDSGSDVRITVTDGIAGRSYETRAEAEGVFDFEAAEYIAPVSEYIGSVERDGNDVIVEIIFTKKG